MIKSRYDPVSDPYCYENTHVLRNKANILDQDELDLFEAEMIALRATQDLPAGDFGVEHYCAIHAHYFQDVYDCAGLFRESSHF